MRVRDLSSHELAARLRRAPGLALHTGPFVTRIQSDIHRVVEGVGLLYADYTLADAQGFSDFQVRVSCPPNLRRFMRRQVLFYFDENIPFKPLPFAQAFPMLEWGLNWCITSYANEYLILHAAVIEKDGRAAILPAPPGSGKSTLCAGLIHRGWRLMSDELALISRNNGEVVSIARPVSLKNASIDVIRNYAPGAVIGNAAVDTAKGTVAHLRPPIESIMRMQEHALPAWVIFPRYVKDAGARLSAHSRAEAFIEVAENAFNYSVLGVEGFRVLGDVMDHVQCYDFRYSSLDEAADVFNELAAQ